MYRSELFDELTQNQEEKKELLITTKGKKINKSKFFELIETTANGLIQSGLKQNDTAVIFVPDMIDFTILFLSVLAAGGRVALLDPDNGRAILQEQFDLLRPQRIIAPWVLLDIQSQPRLNLFIPASIKQIPNIKNQHTKIIKTWFWLSNADFSWKKLLKIKPKDNQVLVRHPNEQAIIVPTGWTTGSPKLVIHTFWSLTKTIQTLKKIVKPCQKFYADLPHFVLLWICLWAQVLIGHKNASANQITKWLSKYKIDTIFTPPFRLQKIWKLPTSLKQILLWSAPIHKSFLQELINKVTPTTKLTCIYGMTELLPISVADGRQKACKECEGDYLGNILEWVERKIEDRELILKAPRMYYWYRNQKNTERHSTGDLVKKIDNEIFMIGRKKDMIISGDYNIYPWLYEPLIMELPRVEDCALIGIRNKNNQDEKILLCIQTPKNKIPTPTQIQKIKEIFPSRATPHDIVINHIPHTWRQQKTNKKLLQNIYRNHFTWE